MSKTKREHGKKGANLPNTKALKDMAQILTTPEAAEYGAQQLEALLIKTGMSNDSIFQKALNIFKDIAKYVSLAFSGGNSWSGKMPPSAYQNMKQGLAAQSVSQINVQHPIRFNYTVGPQAQFAKSFAASITGSDGKKKMGEIDKATSAALDDQLRGWLAKHNWKNENGHICPIDDLGNIKQDARGKEQHVDPEIVKATLADEKEGFEAYVKQSNDGLQIEANEFDYQDYVKSRAEAEAPSAEAGQSMGG